MGREDVAEVGAIEDIFKCGKDANPDWHAPVGGDEAGSHRGQCLPWKGKKE